MWKRKSLLTTGHSQRARVQLSKQSLLSVIDGGSWWLAVGGRAVVLPNLARCDFKINK